MMTRFVFTVISMSLVAAAEGNPAVSLNMSPAYRIPVEAPVNFTLQAVVSEGSNPVSKIRFLDGDKTLKTLKPQQGDQTYICSISLSSGVHTLLAEVTDKRGAVGISAPMVVEVGNLPTVSLVITTPTGKFVAPANIKLAAEFENKYGFVTRVDFYRGKASVGTSNADSPHVVLENLQAGTYSFTARVMDNSGRGNSSTPQVIEVKPNPDPAPRRN
jgi:hypothetical protein